MPSIKQTEQDDRLGHLLEIANRMDDTLRSIAAEFARLRADFESALAIEDARRREDYANRMRQGLQSPYLARGFLAYQQPRIDGDHEPWEPLKRE